MSCVFRKSEIELACFQSYDCCAEYIIVSYLRSSITPSRTAASEPLFLKQLDHQKTQWRRGATEMMTAITQVLTTSVASPQVECRKDGERERGVYTDDGTALVRYARARDSANGGASHVCQRDDC